MAWDIKVVQLNEIAYSEQETEGIWSCEEGWEPFSVMKMGSPKRLFVWLRRRV